MKSLLGSCLRVLVVALSSLGLMSVIWPGTVPADVFEVPVTWSRPGADLPEVKWTPWLPQPYAGMRYRFGFRYTGTPSLDVKGIMEVTLTVPPGEVKFGQKLPVMVKLTSRACTGDEENFESHFGLELPNEVKLGLGTGVGPVSYDVAWYDAPVDIWDLLGFVPTVGDMLAAGGHLNVVVKGKKVMPLTGGSVAFTDTGGLAGLSFSAADISSATKDGILQDVADAVFPAIGGALSKQTIKKIAGKGVDKLLEYATVVAVQLQPGFTLQGTGATVWIRTKIGDDEGLFPVFFDNQGQTQTLTLYIPPYTRNATGVCLQVAGIDYGVRIRQSVHPKVQFSGWSHTFAIEDKTVFDGKATARFPVAGNPYQMTVPLAPPEDIFAFVEKVGTTSAGILFHTINFPTKGKLLVFRGAKQNFNPSQATVCGTDYDFKSAHALTATSLIPDTTYSYVIECTTPSGRRLLTSPREFKTKKASEASPRNSQTTTDVNLVGTPTVSNITHNSATISWTTLNDSSTMVLKGETPEYGMIGTWVIKVKEGSGWRVDERYQGGTSYLEKQHSITLTGLSPGTRYYYSAISWAFNGSQPLTYAEVANKTFTTLDLVAPKAKVLVKSGSTVLPGARVWGYDGARTIGYMSTGTDGYTEEIGLEGGKSYTFVADAPGYKMGQATYAAGSTPGPTTLSWAVNLVPSPSYPTVVLDARSGQPLAGVTATLASPSRSVVTAADGKFMFGNLAPGSYQVQVSKSNYFTEASGFSVAPNGVFNGGLVNLVPMEVAAEITVKGDDGAAVTARVDVCGAVGSTAIYATQSLGANGILNFTRAVSARTPMPCRVRATPTGASANLYNPTEDDWELTPGRRPQIKLVCARRDSTPPVISNRTATQLSPVSWKITWKTDELANCQIDFLKGAEAQPWFTTPAVFGDTQEYTLDLTSQPGTVADKARLIYQYRIRATDISGNGRTAPYEQLPRDTTPPTISQVVAKVRGFLDWSVSWKTDTACTCTLEIFRDGSDQPVFTQTRAAATTHTLTADLTKAPGLPANPGQFAYRFRVKASNDYGNEAVLAPTALPRDEKPPKLGKITAVRKAPGQWLVAVAASKPCTYRLDVLPGKGSNPAAVASLTSSAKATEDCQLLVTLGADKLAALAGTGAVVQVAATDAWGNTSTSPRQRLDIAADVAGLGGAGADSAIPIKGKLLVPRDGRVAAGRSVGITCQVGGAADTPFEQIWVWKISDQGATGKIREDTETHAGRTVKVTRAFPPGHHALVVTVRNTETRQTAEFTATIHAVGKDGEEPGAILEGVKPSFEIAVEPKQEIYRPGDRLTLVVRSEDPELARIEVKAAGKSLRSLAGSSLVRSHGRYEVRIPYVIPARTTNAIEVVPTVTAPDGTQATAILSLPVGPRP